MGSILVGRIMRIRVLMFAMVSVAVVLMFTGGQWSTLAAGPGSENSDTPRFTQDGKMEFPANYREWVYLTTGLDMSYRQGASGMGDHHMFDNVFVNPAAYKAFQETGTWPDQTVLVLEVRGAGSNASINKSGHFQTTDLMGREVHVKDKRLPGGWAFYPFDDDKPATAIPHTANCYSCHEQHAAVDTTFVQFYPTLLPIATKKGTLSEAYKSDEVKKN